MQIADVTGTDLAFKQLSSKIPVHKNKSYKGRGQAGKVKSPRTIEVCRILSNDKDDMVVKAISRALRELIPYDADQARHFLSQNEEILAPRIKREVKNKLITGLKNPWGKTAGSSFLSKFGVTPEELSG